MNILNTSTTKELYKEWILENYPLIWKQITTEYQQNRNGGRVWMLDAANYLFQTAQVRWAVDPVYSALFVSAPDDVANDLQGLDLVLLTHLHGDHFDVSLLKQLCRCEHLVIAVPEFMSEALLAEVDDVECDLRIVSSGSIITVGDLKATAFDSIHFDEPGDDGKSIGCNELGWLIEVDGKRILMPCDVRNYKLYHQLSDSGHINWLFAHLWLGRGKSIVFDKEDLDNYCRYVGHFHADNVCFTHLHEISRELDDYWSFTHAGLVMDRLLAFNPGMRSMAVRTGQGVTLW